MVDALAHAGNPSSVHAEGRKARAIVETARRDVAALFDVAAADVFFTSGASEANAWVVRGGWAEILLSPLEHDSVLKSAKMSDGRVVSLAVTGRGEIDLGAVRETVDRSTTVGRRLISVVAANNETGVIQPVEDVCAIARNSGYAVFSDAVQVAARLGPGHLRSVDFISVSAHKIGGPKGVGALILRGGAELPALIAGGGQERGRRAGTENVAGIAGFGAAARVARRDVASFGAVADLRDRLLAGLREVTPDMMVLGDGAPRLVNTLCVGVPGMAADVAVIQMDLAGVAVSAGSACSSGKVGASATLAAMAVSPELQRAAIRFSLGCGTTRQDIDAAIAAWRGISGRARAAA